MPLEYKFEPLHGSFPRDLTPGYFRQSSPFGKTWTETQNLLEKELGFLKPGHDRFAIRAFWRTGKVKLNEEVLHEPLKNKTQTVYFDFIAA